MKAISLKLESRQLRLLEQASKTTHIPKSALVRKGIDLVLQEIKSDVLSAEFRREVDVIVADDKELLRRLGDA